MADYLRNYQEVKEAYEAAGAHLEEDERRADRGGDPGAVGVLRLETGAELLFDGDGGYLGAEIPVEKDGEVRARIFVPVADYPLPDPAATESETRIGRLPSQADLQRVAAGLSFLLHHWTGESRGDPPH